MNTVTCTNCRKEVSKYVCTYVTTIDKEVTEYEERNPEGFFDEILCPKCKLAPKGHLNE